MTGRFEGWYYKQQTGHESLALIPAVHTDSRGCTTGSLQIITKNDCAFIPLPCHEKPGSGLPVFVRLGDCTFSSMGLTLNISTEQVTAAGQLTFSERQVPQGDIMGPYRYVPVMECRHSVYSMTHKTNGTLIVNGKVYDFTNAQGYMEGDSGRSFPKRYIWTQCSWQDGGPCALMLSAATVRPLGFKFTGIVGFVLLGGKELRLATYRGAKALAAGNGLLIIQQGPYTLKVQLLADSPHPLHAPVSGEMVRLIRESLTATVRFTLTEHSTTVFDFISDQASFEDEFHPILAAGQQSPGG